MARYNECRPHGSLGGLTPREVHDGDLRERGDGGGPIEMAWGSLAGAVTTPQRTHADADNLSQDENHRRKREAGLLQSL